METKAASIVFPHQLFENNPALGKKRAVFLVEEFLFFKQYKFHKQKLIFHRASMKFYENYLRVRGFRVNYIDAAEETADIRKLIPYLKQQGFNEIHYVEPVDNWLEKRILKASDSNGIKTYKYDSPTFLNSEEELQKYFAGRKKYSQTDFYVHQRKKRNILLDKNDSPVGSKWTFDSENRLKYPAGKNPPEVEFPKPNSFYMEAREYVEKNFPDNYGEITDDFIYPATFNDSKKWLAQFFELRFNEFGPYEDAIVYRESILHHSVLTPMLNTGLLTPGYVIEEALIYSEKNNIPLNSLEGFIRQIIGWREFVRGIYVVKGTEQRNRNFWDFNKKIPDSFWSGKTGIEPLDLTIKKVLKTGYCHHIERLMVIGNFMLLCEFDPDEVYRWFMELFIDAYDWVMVPNVYGMSQFADRGLMATKPYISGSNYLMKMSNFKKGDWQLIWDGLFWRFMDKHRDFFLSNPRLGMLVKTFDKMPFEKREFLINTANGFLKKL